MIRWAVAAVVLGALLASCGRATPVAVIHVVPGSSGPSYRPGVLRLSVGSEATWVNEDPRRVCTVTSAANTFGSRFLRYGERYTLRFNAPGTYRYFCENDRTARGEVVVNP